MVALTFQRSGSVGVSVCAMHREAGIERGACFKHERYDGGGYRDCH